MSEAKFRGEIVIKKDYVVNGRLKAKKGTNGFINFLPSNAKEASIRLAERKNCITVPVEFFDEVSE